MAQPTVYLSGPMRGCEDFNYPAFNKAADYLRRQFKLSVFNPAEMDTGTDAPLDTYIDRDIGALRKLVPGQDVVVVLAGWKKSRGAVAEVAYAQWRGIMVLNYATWEPVPLVAREFA